MYTSVSDIKFQYFVISTLGSFICLVRVYDICTLIYFLAIKIGVVFWF